MIKLLVILFIIKLKARNISTTIFFVNKANLQPLSTVNQLLVEFIFISSVTAQKMKFSIKDFFSKYDQIRCGFGQFTEEILNGKLHFLCSEFFSIHQ